MAGTSSSLRRVTVVAALRQMPEPVNIAETALERALRDANRAFSDLRIKPFVIGPTITRNGSGKCASRAAIVYMRATRIPARGMEKLEERFKVTRLGPSRFTGGAQYELELKGAPLLRST